MESSYDNFVDELGIYKNMGARERNVFKIARLFGECDVNIPKDFVNEVLNYIKNGRLRNG